MKTHKTVEPGNFHFFSQAVMLLSLQPGVDKRDFLEKIKLAHPDPDWPQADQEIFLVAKLEFLNWYGAMTGQSRWLLT